MVERRRAFHVAEEDDVLDPMGRGGEAGFDMVPVAVDVADEDEAGVVGKAQGRGSGVGGGG
jgi:hypothetical protein